MRKILIVLIVFLVLGGAVGFYLYNKPHDDMRSAKPDGYMKSVMLFSLFQEDEGMANQIYLGKIIEVTGVVMESIPSSDGGVGVTLEGRGMFGVTCKLDPEIEHPRREFTPGETATFRGVCTGLLMDVVLERCVEVPTQ